MRELCLMPWLRFAGTVDPARGPTIPADPPPICCADAAGGEKCPKNRTEKQENLEKQAVFWYNMCDLLCPLRLETWGHPCEVSSHGGHRCHAAGVKMGGLQYSTSFL